jgi:hypothetical protein
MNATLYRYIDIFSYRYNSRREEAGTRRCPLVLILALSENRPAVFKTTYSANGLIFGLSGANVAEVTRFSGGNRQESVRFARMNITDEVVYSYGCLERRIGSRETPIYL